MTSYATIRFDGVAHIAVSTPSASAKRLGMTTAQFSVAGHPARIVESVDSNEVGASVIRYEGSIETDHGCMWVQSYDSAAHATTLLSAIDPTVTPLGVTIGENHRVEYVNPPEVLLDVPDFALLAIMPLTEEVLATAPDWKGTSVAGGELFAASMSRTSPMLTLVTDSAYVNILPPENPDMDRLTQLAASLQVSWKA